MVGRYPNQQNEEVVHVQRPGPEVANLQSHMQSPSSTARSSPNSQRQSNLGTNIKAFTARNGSNGGEE
ncbi:hypothetical protein CY34DRAFT_806675 [Suillus luteus UH-Slu-Lm8-n1]|uniref:Uncharacterized protein n=1 Tax=Suillus luteus UH-Slu-Lm8-n1 TaxID=930992 RepID=A0A0C9ZSY8_9AGAM|nr:hypothetical protein CY34DRAFT_806675 [Suillus luteus UH-Slu-Lm8-n1]